MTSDDDWALSYRWKRSVQDSQNQSQWETGRNVTAQWSNIQNITYIIVPLLCVLLCTMATIINARILLCVKWIRRPLSPTLYISLSLALADTCSAILVATPFLPSRQLLIWHFSSHFISLADRIRFYLQQSSAQGFGRGRGQWLPFPHAGSIPTLGNTHFNHPSPSSRRQSLFWYSLPVSFHEVVDAHESHHSRGLYMGSTHRLYFRVLRKFQESGFSTRRLSHRVSTHVTTKPTFIPPPSPTLICLWYLLSVNRKTFYVSHAFAQSSPHCFSFPLYWCSQFIFTFRL